LDLIERAKNVMAYNDSAAMHKIKFRSNDCEITLMLKHNQHHQITFTICSSGICYNSCTAAN